MINDHDDDDDDKDDDDNDTKSHYDSHVDGTLSPVSMEYKKIFV